MKERREGDIPRRRLWPRMRSEKDRPKSLETVVGEDVVEEFERRFSAKILTAGMGEISSTTLNEDLPSGKSQDRQAGSVKNWRRTWREKRAPILITAGVVTAVAGGLTALGLTTGNEGGGSSSYSAFGWGVDAGAQPSVDQTQVTANQLKQLKMPYDKVAGLLEKDGIDPNLQSTKRLIVEPEQVRVAFGEFLNVMKETPFQNLIFPDGQPVGQILQSLKETDTATLSNNFSASASNDEISYDLTSGNDSVMNSGTNISVQQTFVVNNGAVSDYIEMTARVVDGSGNIDGHVDTVSDSAASESSFNLEYADTLVQKLGFQPALPAELVPDTEIMYTDNDNNTLTIYSNGLLVYRISSREANNVPNLRGMVAVAANSPIQEAAVLVNAALISNPTNGHGPINVFDIARSVTGKKSPSTNSNQLSQDLYTESEAAA